MTIRIITNPSYTVQRFKPKYQRAQMWLDNEVLKDCEPFVPFRTGNLVRSGQRGTLIGSGLVVYNAPYAADCYYRNKSFSKEKHPQATRQWFEKSKAINKKKWSDGSAKMVKE